MITFNRQICIMKNHSTCFIYFLVLTIAFTSCGKKCKEPSGKNITQNRTVTTFNHLSVNGDFNVTLIQDTALTFQITGDENFMESIQSEVKGNTLEIKQEGKCSGDKINLVIHSRDFEEINLAGNIDLKTQGNLKLKDVELNFAGLINADVDLNAHDVETNAAGKSTIKIKGQASEHKVNMNGNGTLEAFDFIVAKYDVTTAGSTECKINVLNELSAKSSGSGDIEYKGNPSKINQDISGNGKIQKAP